ncbi:DUF6039 family protein [Streptomyces diastaticus]|uniref:DUF6039 family protein n=1 Tax=Streptomyces diastaticus TaxID=1956 RepID=UPI0033F0D18F
MHNNEQPPPIPLNSLAGKCSRNATCDLSLVRAGGSVSTEKSSGAETGGESDLVLTPAQRQTSVGAEKMLHSANSGMIVERTVQVRGEFHSESRRFARELAEYINTRYQEVAGVFVYEETFGTKDLIHWLIHLKSMDHYETMVRMGSRDEDYRALFGREWVPEEKGGGGWARMVLDGTLRETVLLPQFWGMYGTHVDGETERQSEVYRRQGAEVTLPPARHQTTQPDELLLHSGNAGILIHRTAEILYDFRSEARQFAREAAEAINDNLAGEATVLLYEEAFGPMDRIHWLIHMKSLSTYQRLLQLHVQNESVRDIFFRERAPEKGGVTWARMFTQGSYLDTALTPHHWGLYATGDQADETVVTGGEGEAS